MQGSQVLRFSGFLCVWAWAGLGEARPGDDAYWSRPANEVAVARLREAERVMTSGAKPVATLGSRLDALAALDQRLGFDERQVDQPHAVSALYTAEGHLSHLFANRLSRLVDQRPLESPESTVRRFVSENPSLWDLQVLDREVADLVEILPVPEVTSDPMPNGHSYTTVRYDQRWRGHPLADGTLTVHFADGKRMMAVSGLLINQADTYFDPEPALGESDAEALAAEFSADAAPELGELHGRVRDLVGFAGERRLVYRVDVADDSDSLLFQTWIDAQTAELVRQSPQWGEYEAVASTYNVFHPLTTDADWTGAAPANSLMKSGAYSSYNQSTNSYYHFDNGAVMRSPMKVYNEEAGGATVTFDPNGSTVWDDPPGSEAPGQWYNRKFNASHVSYWSQVFRNYLDTSMTLGSGFSPPTGYGPWKTWVIIAGAWTDPNAANRPAVTHWGCNFPSPWRNDLGLLAHPADETGRVCIVLPKVGQTQGQSAAGLDGAYSARVLWHEMGHGVDFLYGAGAMRPDGEPNGLGGSGGFHEPAAAVMQLVTVARHFSTAYAFNDYDTATTNLTAQVGSSASTPVDLNAGTRKCYPIDTFGQGINAYNFGHPLYQAVWEAARGRHCHGASCVNLNDGGTTADAMEAAYWALKYCPSGPSSTLSEFAHWFVLYYLSFGTQAQWENRAQIFARHDLTNFYPNVACDGNAAP